MAVRRGSPPAVDSSGKAPDAYRTISEAAEIVGVPQHVLRFWETRFSQIRPVKRAGGRRHYRPDDLALLTRIRDLLHGEGYSIRGVQQLLKRHGVRAVVEGRVEDELPRDDGAAAADRLPRRDALESILEELVEIRSLLP